jgi:hypothetical protein
MPLGQKRSELYPNYVKKLFLMKKEAFKNIFESNMKLLNSNRKMALARLIGIGCVKRWLWSDRKCKKNIYDFDKEVDTNYPVQLYKQLKGLIDEMKQVYNKYTSIFENDYNGVLPILTHPDFGNSTDIEFINQKLFDVTTEFNNTHSTYGGDDTTTTILSTDINGSIIQKNIGIQKGTLYKMIDPILSKSDEILSELKKLSNENTVKKLSNENTVKKLSNENTEVSNPIDPEKMKIIKDTPPADPNEPIAAQEEKLKISEGETDRLEETEEIEPSQEGQPQDASLQPAKPAQKAQPQNK